MSLKHYKMYGQEIRECDSLLYRRATKATEISNSILQQDVYERTAIPQSGISYQSVNLLGATEMDHVSPAEA